MSMILTKSIFQIYNDCRKNAWLKLHRPDIHGKKTLSAFEQMLMDTGNEVDLYARKLFPNGYAVYNRDDFEYSNKLIAQHANIIYQPVFSGGRFLAVPDILVWNESAYAYDLYEVKASSGNEDEENDKVKKQHIQDVAFQKIALQNSGVAINSFFLVRLNKEYIRQGEIIVQELFTIKNIDVEVAEIEHDIHQRMEEAYAYLSRIDEPRGECDCWYKIKNNHCTTAWYSLPNMPAYSIHSISRLSSKKIASLLEAGIVDIKDVPPDFELSEIQRRQVEVAVTNTPFIDKGALHDFFSHITHPISFLDYESFPAGIPRFEGYSPYNQIPFQFSLHIAHDWDSSLEHYEFIHTTVDNPDIPFLEALKKYLPSSGSIVVWNKKFELAINAHLCKRHPEYEMCCRDWENRVVDAMEPFSGNTSAIIYPGFKGSASIKYVLPTLVPSLSYADLEIKEGGSASDLWNKIVSQQFSPQERLEKISHLKKYCARDSIAMYEIMRAVKKLVERS